MNLKRLFLEAAERRRSDFECFMAQDSDTVLWHAPGLFRRVYDLSAAGHVPSFLIVGTVNSGKTRIAKIILKFLPTARVTEKTVTRSYADGYPILGWRDMAGYNVVIAVQNRRRYTQVRFIKSRFHEQMPGPFKVTHEP